MRKRETRRELSNSRIYQKRNRFYLFSKDEIENPITGKLAKWHSLCHISEGELQARIKANEIIKHNTTAFTKGDLPAHMEIYRKKILAKRKEDKPKDPQRAILWDKATKEITRQCVKIAEAFQDFDVHQVLPVDIAEYVDQWEGKRMAQVWHSRLSDFFSWTCRKGLRSENPCREVKVEKPKAKKTYITHAQFHAIRKAAMTGKDGKATMSGGMVQCYIDLCYLMYQRTTEIRLLKWSQVDDESGVIHFTPTKTERSSGASVDIPITPEVRTVLERARSIGTIKSMYVIHTHNGKPYSAWGIGSAWNRARERAGIDVGTLRDLRAKALTDAKENGYSMKQLQVAGAHTDQQMTAEYIRHRVPEKSQVVMKLPPEN